ncbi:tryptophan halogenase family protein [Gilvimarinus xylanilyticus]|uniref:Tryptophan 7-halogenase n=1 Tax=Gilvimarinus xylanilyticus TaxID=2944139 RepID=A0A9X2I6N0_9GAMM|nr:tryptophan halogenase family protein [Gilvimarinus xylanilyticus]MCP8900412.1 tryptophan 7-halogenase [Gilvimarinus xylanilyticus]
MNTRIKNIVVLGGGTAGWMSAALLKKVLGGSVNITLVESDEIATVGVGEATIPPIQHVNRVLGINEAEFLRETNATMKLAIKFENWYRQGQGYFHTFSSPGQSSAFCQFHHYWLRAKRAGLGKDLWDYDLNYLALSAGKFAKLETRDPRLELPYAYHFDAGLYGAYLRKISQALGVKRIEGKVNHTTINQDTGAVEQLLLASGVAVSGDLFIDCSGFRALLLQQKLGVGFDDWSHWLPCDRAVAVPSERLAQTRPYTRAIAHHSGWQWQIPLQHRQGNGLVYSSRFSSDEQATQTLLQNLECQPVADPRVIHFRTGRARQQWHKNVIGVGLASGFLEPLESTSIHLVQSAIVRLLKYFPHTGIQADVVKQYNQESRIEYEQVRDFLILHYKLNRREDSEFWQQMARISIPESLQHKIDVFAAQGVLVRERNDIFAESSWLQLLLGQGVEPRDHHPLAGAMDEAQLANFMQQTEQLKREPITAMHFHDDFLQRFDQA